MLHGASCEGFLSFWQVQPQSICFHFVGTDDDDIDPGCSAGIPVNARGQGEVIGDDWGGREESIKDGFSHLSFSAISDACLDCSDSFRGVMCPVFRLTGSDIFKVLLN